MAKSRCVAGRRMAWQGDVWQRNAWQRDAWLGDVWQRDVWQRDAWLGDVWQRDVWQRDGDRRRMAWPYSPKMVSTPATSSSMLSMVLMVWRNFAE